MNGMGPRVYCGDDGHWSGPVPGRAYVDLVGGPLDGQLLDVTGWSEAERADGALLSAGGGLFGPGGRVFYGPAEADSEGPFIWDGETP